MLLDFFVKPQNGLGWIVFAFFYFLLAFLSGITSSGSKLMSYELDARYEIKSSS